MDDVNRDLSRLEDVLEGLNYTVFLRAYEIEHESDADPTAALAIGFPDASFDKVVAAPVDLLLKRFDHYVFYRGDDSHGPDAAMWESAEFPEAHNVARSHLQSHCWQTAERYTFVIRDGHPAYPVFWEFSFLLWSPNRSFVWIGCSSD